MADPKTPKTETLERYMGRELRARYLNPKWINAMLAEGYAGARFANMVVEHLWGWQVTVPEAVDGAKWQEMYETWVADKHQLGIRDKFRAAKNMLAYQALVDRMLVAVKKGYWQADPNTVAALEQANREAIAEAGVACHRHTCSSPEISARAEQQDALNARQANAQAAPRAGDLRQATAMTAPASAQAQATKPTAAVAPAASAPAEEAPPQVQGFEMEEKKSSAPIITPEVEAGLLLLLLMVAGGGFFARHRWLARRNGR